ncbi:M48 family metallopeptidase [Nocardioides montaniterrae]
MGKKRTGADGPGRVALATMLVGGALFVLLAGLLVPWHPVPGGMPNPVAARSVFTGAQVDRGEHFALWARIWSWSALAVSLAVSITLAVSRRVQRWAERRRGPWPVRTITLVMTVVMVGRLVSLPFAIGSQQLFLDHGLATDSWGAWSADLAKSTTLEMVVTAIGVVLLIGSAGWWPRWWPAIAGGVLGVLVFVGSFVYPVLVEPMFNQFHPLPEGSLRSSILQLADREGVAVQDVLVADASRRTTTLNAYVSGFGSTRRVVLYDNVVDTLPPGEIEAIVAHELAHAKHDDVLIGTAVGAAGGVFGLGLLASVVLLLERRGWPGARNPASVPLLLGLIAVGSFLALPAQNAISRQIETHADVTALQVTRAPGPFIDMQRRLALSSVADPTPPALSQWWFGSHPTVLQRIAIARQIAAGAAR